MLIILQSILWSVFGVIIDRERIVSKNIPRLLGRALYWLGVPIQIFFLARRSNFEQIIWLPPLVTVLVLLMGLALALIISRTFKLLLPRKLPILSLLKTMFARNPIPRLKISTNVESALVVRTIYQKLLPTTSSETGSFILASILGNTGFIGLALIPPLVDRDYWSWIVLYGVAHNILGSYGLGALIADYYSYSKTNNNWWERLQNLLFLPSLWAFAYGYISRDLDLPDLIETFVSQAVLLVVPGAFILIGMQLSKLQQWQNLRVGIFPALLKMLVLPGITGLLLTCFGMRGDSRLVLVLMSGMPTAFASIILTEAYNLDRNTAASSILLSTVSLPLVLLLWLSIF